MEMFDIVQLIEKNSITRLSKDYENKLINKVKEHFTENQQHLFVASFYCYLNFDSYEDFVIDFDNIWKWVGFSRKDNAKKILTKNFINDIDYQIKKLFPEAAGASREPQHGGQNKETIMLTINTFKKFCLKAGTKKADEIHDYYIKLEKLLQETINEQSNEMKNNLKCKYINFKNKMKFYQRL